MLLTILSGCQEHSVSSTNAKLSRVLILTSDGQIERQS